jgi:hypothetical protein
MGGIRVRDVFAFQIGRRAAHDPAGVRDEPRHYKEPARGAVKRRPARGRRQRSFQPCCNGPSAYLQLIEGPANGLTQTDKSGALLEELKNSGRLVSSGAARLAFSGLRLE